MTANVALQLPRYSDDAELRVFLGDGWCYALEETSGTKNLNKSHTTMNHAIIHVRH